MSEPAPKTFMGDLADLSASLLPLVTRRHWVSWKWVFKDGRWTKPPYRADDPEQFAKTDDPTTWCSFPEAMKALTGGCVNGIGFALKDSGICAIDLDHCRNASSGAIDDWAADIISRAPGAYTEITPSGIGLRIIGTGSGASIHKKFAIADAQESAAVELYRGATRYITVSGLQIGACDELPNIDVLLDSLLTEHMKPRTESGKLNGGDGAHDRDAGERSIRDIIKNGSPEGRRSEDFNRVVWSLAGMGYAIDEIERRLAEYPNGIAAKYAERLRPEIERCYAKWKARQESEPRRPNCEWHYHDEAPAAPTSWLIKNILPATGAGLAAGQWGSFKTTMALDMSVSVMAEVPFAGRFAVRRRGGVIYFALEGASGLKSRLDTIAQERGVAGILPFAWTSNCPPLMAPDALDTLTREVEEAARRIKERFDLPTVLIWVDTIIAGAGYMRAGDDNDAAAAQRLMSVLAGLSERSSALAVGLDHFGKIVETGTRGSSAKEGAADVVLALLADRELGGTVSNTRLAIRKLREGEAGLELPFVAKTVEIGTDQDGDPITRVVIDWSLPQSSTVNTRGWARSLLLLRRILMTTIATLGREAQPFPDGPIVRACDLKDVRTEFLKQYPADGDTSRQKSEARRKAFTRAIIEAQAKGLVATREINDVQLVWLVGS